MIDIERVREKAKQKRGKKSKKCRLREWLDRFEPDAEMLERIMPDLLPVIQAYHEEEMTCDDTREAWWIENGRMISWADFLRLHRIAYESFDHDWLHRVILNARLRTRGRISVERRELGRRLTRVRAIMYLFYSGHEWRGSSPDPKPIQYSRHKRPLRWSRLDLTG